MRFRCFVAVETVPRQGLSALPLPCGSPKRQERANRSGNSQGPEE